MSQQQTAVWNGYTFNIHSENKNWVDAGGIYIFAKVNQLTQRWVPLYIGQASKLSDRLPNHERLNEAIRLGATHIHARVVSTQTDRDVLEAFLIKQHQPVLNEKLK